MIRISLVLSVAAIFVVNLTACAGVPKKPNLSAVYMGIADRSCAEVVSLIPARLEDLEFPFVWIEESEQLLSVGPILEDTDPGNVFSKIEHTYYLGIVCEEELITRITNEISLKGLTSDGKWVEITDVPTIEKYGMRFLQNLDL